MARQFLKLNDFSGGLNLIRDPRDINLNELVQADNISVNTQGKIVTGINTDETGGNANFSIADVYPFPGGGLFYFESDKEGSANAKDSGEKWTAAIDSLTGQLTLKGRVTGDVSTIADLGTPTKLTATSNAFQFESSAILSGGGTPVVFENFFSISDFISISGCTDVTANNRITQVKYVTASGTNLMNVSSLFTSESSESGTVVIQKLIEGVFFASEDTLRVGDGSLSTGTKRQQRGYIKQTRFKDAGAAADDYDNWFTNDCSLTPPTELVIHASSYPSAGTGFHLNITTPATTSDIIGQFAAKKYQIASSFIYKGNQESLLYVPTSNNVFTTASGDYVDIDINASPAYDERITGARIYIKPDGTNEPWSLLLDIDLRDGCRTGMDDVYKSWAIGSGATEAGCDTLILTSENLETYSILNGFSPNEFSITLSENGENYKDAILANRRAFACNVSMLDENIPSFTDATCDYNNDPTITMDDTANVKVGMGVSGTGIPTGSTVVDVTSATTFELSASTTGGSVTNGTLTFSGSVKRMRDRIMFTPPNKFETFPRSFFIDVVKGDSDEYTALATFGDRLFAYKRETLYIINIGSPSPSNWFLESTERKKGVVGKSAIYYNEDGIFWANQYGAFAFNGSSIVNLIKGKLKYNDWGLYALNNPSVAYDDITKSLYVLPYVVSLDTNGLQDLYVYSFDSQSWTKMSYFKGTAMDKFLSNFISDGQGSIVFNRANAQGGSTSVSQEGFTDTGQTIASGKIIIKTKDIDFGDPGRIKKIYSIRITYKSSAAQTTPIAYAINGSNNFTGSGGGNFVGDFASASSFDVLVATPSTPIECQSLQLQISNPTNTGSLEINDISIEYRTLYKRVS